MLALELAACVAAGTDAVACALILDILSISTMVRRANAFLGGPLKLLKSMSEGVLLWDSTAANWGYVHKWED